MHDTFMGHTLDGATLTGAHEVDPARLAPFIRLVSANGRAGGMLSAAVAASLLCQPAIGAPGDLDPAFGNVGRAIPVVDQGPVWAIEETGDDYLYAGGEYYCGYYTCEDPAAFFGELTGTGASDPAYASAVLENTVVYDMAAQPDGKAVGTGFVRQSGVPTMTVFRLLANGALDTSFGTGGTVHLSDPGGGNQVGRAVIIEPDGRVVIAGNRGGNPVVIRLLADGALDMNFGTAGVYVASTLDSAGNGGLVRVPDGGYRLLAASSGCRVLGLDANGIPDASFGTSGIAPADSQAPESAYCTDLAMQADESLVLVGHKNDNAFITRLLPGGARDPGFSGAALAGIMGPTSAVTLGHHGSIVVAGRDSTGLPGAVIVRLQANGVIDTLFGNGGAAIVDVEWPNDPYAMIRDMQVLADDRIVVAGGGYYNRKPFVARLLGAGAGPGIVGIKTSTVVAVRDSQAVIDVRRTGGSSGAVSVAFRTEAGSATASSDYTEASGQLSWGDGDGGDRQITVPILAGGASSTQSEELFQVILSNPQGGAGLGTYGASVQIPAAGYPAGIIFATPVTTLIKEGLVVQFEINRLYYSAGAVSVTVTPVGGTATAGQDFVATPVVVNWADGDPSPKFVSVTVMEDKKDEKTETFSVALSAPTGGALVSSDVPQSVTINDDDSGGGGRFGALAALLLGFAGVQRRRRRSG